jgi:hypothetical protein
MRQLLRNYGLSITLLVLFLVSWSVQTVVGWREFIAEQAQHGETAEVFGASGYFWTWAGATFENWQSEFLQLLTFVVLTRYLIHKGSHESKDTDEEMQAQLTRMEKKIERLDRREQRHEPRPSA